MEKKKLKLKISEGSKKTINNIELAKSQGKNSVIIEKKTLDLDQSLLFLKIIYKKKLIINLKLILLLI